MPNSFQGTVVEPIRIANGNLLLQLFTVLVSIPIRNEDIFKFNRFALGVTNWVESPGGKYNPYPLKQTKSGHYVHTYCKLKSGPLN